jgi:hypothetical protein
MGVRLVDEHHRPGNAVRLAVLMGSLIGTVIGTAACDRSPDPPAAPTITLTTPPQGGTAYVEVKGLPGRTLRALDRDDLNATQWSAILRVAVTLDAPAVLGEYAVADGALRFTPLFPFDEGRRYQVRFDPGRLPGAAADAGGVVEGSVGRPASTTTPSTSVVRVYPSGEEVPENLLRMYIEFSGPMGRKSGVEHISLLDQAGREIIGAVLPLDYEFWSPDHTRFTVFFDPGRVKKGILPNREMGRPLETGRSMTLVVSREWRDEHGLPLKEDFKRTFRVGPPEDKPIDPSSWRIQPPAAGTRDGVIVTFPRPLDHGLLLRALGVTLDRKTVNGDIVLEPGETRWVFTPNDPWRAGAYRLLALEILEDPAGNQIGRAFEVSNAGPVDKGPSSKTITLPFNVK